MHVPRLEELVFDGDDARGFHSALGAQILEDCEALLPLVVHYPKREASADKPVRGSGCKGGG